MRVRSTMFAPRRHTDAVGSALTVIFLFFGLAFIDAALSRNWTFTLIFGALCALAVFGGIRPGRR